MIRRTADSSSATAPRSASSSSRWSASGRCSWSSCPISTWCRRASIPSCRRRRPRRPEDILTLEQYRSFLFAADRRHAQRHPYRAFCLLDRRLGSRDACQLRHLLSARLLHGPGRQCAEGAPPDAGADRSLLGERDACAPLPCACSSPPGASSTRCSWRSGIIDAPIDFLGINVGLYVGLSYAYLLVMIFPLYNAIESLDKNQIEAARDLGAPWWHIHQNVVMPLCQARHRVGLHAGLHAFGRLARRAAVPRRPEDACGSPRSSMTSSSRPSTGRGALPTLSSCLLACIALRAC